MRGPPSSSLEGVSGGSIHELRTGTPRGQHAPSTRAGVGGNLRSRRGRCTRVRSGESRREWSRDARAHGVPARDRLAARVPIRERRQRRSWSKASSPGVTNSSAAASSASSSPPSTAAASKRSKHLCGCSSAAAPRNRDRWQAGASRRRRLAGATPHRRPRCADEGQRPRRRCAPAAGGLEPRVPQGRPAPRDRGRRGRASGVERASTGLTS